MKNILKSPSMGIVQLTVLFLPSLALALAASLLKPGSFSFEGKYLGAAFAAGIELAIFGLGFAAASVFVLVRAHRSSRLATTGPLALSRYPLFAWWIFSVLPSAALLLDSWLFLAAAAWLRFLSGKLAATEEPGLLDSFGAEFSRYKARTRPFLPLPFIRPIGYRRYVGWIPPLAALGLAALLVFAFVARPAMLSFGATRTELRASLPGDEYVGSAATGYTQAIDVAVPPDELWKWLVQVGYKKAGWYNIDLFNRILGPEYFYDRRGSAVRIIPRLQDLRLGDKIYLVPVLGLTVVEAERGRNLVMVADPSRKGGDNVAWSFSIVPRGDNTSRLITRFRSQGSSGLLLDLAEALFNQVGGATLQQPAMLWGVKVRAERSYAGKLM